MKLIILFNILFLSTFHPVAESNEGNLNLQVIKKGSKTMLYVDVANAEQVDSLIIHTDIWQVKLGHSSFTDECIFEINTAEEIVLSQDEIVQYEIRQEGKSTYYEATDPVYVRNRLRLEQYILSVKE